jgi:sugar (pentulose or hexulose) kinase
VAAGWSAGAHVVPGVDLLLAGGSGGLLLRRVLAALGADNPEARQRLDVASDALTELPAGLLVRGDSRRSDDVEIRLRDGATPASVWRAATLATAQLAHDMLADINIIVGPHRRAVAAGGWTRMASVRAAKASAIPALEFSELTQPGATGAALLAEYSLGGDNRSLPEYLTQLRRSPAHEHEGES